ncbi:MAG TPA: metal-dependent hydrolase [Candidatus Thermoplasmatota archaeon]|nr:metal-dependent hydrolase [Candidatus Thermoplasmatota archaeon]
MSAALTHLAVGFLLGLALRLPPRYLVLAAFIAASPDIDHLHLFVPVPFLETRVTFHNVFFCIALPLLVYGVLRARGAREEYQHLAAVSPVLLTSHLLLDMMPLDIGSPRVALLYPLNRDWYTMPAIKGYAGDPEAYSTITVILIALGLLTALTLAGLALVRRLQARPGTLFRQGPAAALAAVWLLVFPALAAGGYVIPAPAHPEALFSVQDPSLLMPQGRFTAVVAHLGGGVASRGGLALQVWVDGARVAEAKNDGFFSPGDRWVVDLPLAGDLRAATKIEARLLATSDKHTYHALTPQLRKSHIDVPLEALLERDGGGRALVTLKNEGSLPVPAKAIAARIEGTGIPAENLTNPVAINPGGSWSIPVRTPASLGAGQIQATVVAVDDGHRYLSRTFTVTPVQSS